MNREKYFSLALLLLVTTPAFGQGEIICCNQLIDVGGDWDTSSRDCIGYMNQSTVNRAKVCAHLLRGECPASVDAEAPVMDSLLALLLPATAHGQCVGSDGNIVGCGPSIDLSKMSPPPPRPTVCCPEAAALCGETSCKDDPAREGFVYVSARRVPRLHSEPSADASIVGTPPNGVRLVYRQAVRVGGQTWFHVEPPGGSKGWLSGEDAGCKRPSDIPPPKPINVRPSRGVGPAKTSAAHAPAGRG